MVLNFHDDILVLIVKNLSGQADSIENTQLMEWIGSSANNKKYFEQVRNIWDASDGQIDPTKINTKGAFERILYRVPGKSLKRTLWYYWQKVVAVIILPLVIGTLTWLYFHRIYYFSDSVFNEIHAAYGTRSSLTLSDSTIVWLNSGSNLRYPLRFNKKNREVFLQGEAYFEVKTDAFRPFIVRTPTLQIEAKGTKFNVQDYDLNILTEVTLVSGNISVSESNSSQLISKLKPNQHLVYNKVTEEKSFVTTDPYRFTAWKDGKLIFRNESLEKVLNKIGLIFNVDFELQGKELQEYSYRATFQDESLGEILNLLKLSAPIDYIEVKRTPLPDGSFPKKKVIIFKKKQ